MPRSARHSPPAHAQRSAYIQRHYGPLGLTREEVEALARIGKRSKPAAERLLGLTRRELLERAARAGVRGRWRMTKAELVAALG